MGFAESLRPPQSQKRKINYTGARGSVNASASRKRALRRGLEMIPPDFRAACVDGLAYRDAKKGLHTQSHGNQGIGRRDGAATGSGPSPTFTQSITVPS
jgi:hypothetical protein